MLRTSFSMSSKVRRTARLAACVLLAIAKLAQSSTNVSPFPLAIRLAASKAVDCDLCRPSNEADLAEKTGCMKTLVGLAVIERRIALLNTIFRCQARELLSFMLALAATSTITGHYRTFRSPSPTGLWPFQQGRRRQRPSPSASCSRLGTSWPACENRRLCSGPCIA